MAFSQRRAAAVAAGLAAAVFAADAGADHHQVVGYIEDVRIFPGDIPFRAKLDTGARTSSIDVKHAVVFKMSGKDWVRFTIINRHDQDVTLERPVIRISRVKRAGTERDERYVVRLGICLGTYLKNAEVNLNDRAGMQHRLLIGRLFLEDHFFVNSAARNLSRPDCKVPEAEPE